ATDRPSGATAMSPIVLRSQQVSMVMRRVVTTMDNRSRLHRAANNRRVRLYSAGPIHPRANHGAIGLSCPNPWPAPGQSIGVRCPEDAGGRLVMSAQPSLRYLSRDDVLSSLPPLDEQLELARQTMTALVERAQLPPKVGVHPRPTGAFADAMP